MDYEAVIGLEVHAEMLTQSKIFCGCSAKFGAAPNENVCPLCLGLPGVLPVLNRRVVEFAIKAGLATHCAIAPLSRWARKNYFYPDLPKGYQISQYELPICLEGRIDIEIDGDTRPVRLTRIHMEEDTGKNIHDQHGDASLVDYNRCGVPLLEIVSEPDIRTPAEAGAYLRKLRQILQYLEVCDGNMEEGSFRCDANVSVRPRGTEALGTKAEVKNMNSFRAVEKAIEHEIERQTDLLRHGERVVQETRLWDPDREETRSMRSKESAHDYRYFPDPDLLPLEVSREWVETVRAAMPELPDARRARFVAEHGLPPYDAEVLTARKDIADYFETAVRAHANAKAISNWVMGDPVFDLKGFNLNAKLDIDPEFLNADAHDHAHHDHDHDHDHEHGEHCDHPHHHHHDDDVKSFVFRSHRPFSAAKLEDFLGSIVQVYGPKLLRYKGVLYMKGTERKVVFQGVHQLMGSDLGPAWAAGEKKGSKMVFIGLDLPKDILLQGLEQCLA